MLRKSQTIERKTYENNLLFYTILKTLVQCKLSDQQLLSFQSLLIKTINTVKGNPKKVKSFLSSSEQVTSLNSKTRSPYENLLNLLSFKNAKMWYDMVDVGIELMLFKELILQETNSYNIAKQQATERIADHLSVEYDAANLCQPYGRRVLGSLLAFALTNTGRKKEFLLESSNRRVKQIYSKINNLTSKYSISCNNMYSLIVSESIDQSIVSLAGASYENRVEFMIKPLVSDWENHSHDKNIKAMEYDFTFTLGGKKFGISAKRTLRERYKQNHEDVENLDVDFILVCTLGTDLNENKLASLLQKTGTYIIVSKEIYDSRDYLSSNPKVISSESLINSSSVLTNIITNSLS